MTDKSKKLILGFDAWTLGKHLYLPIANKLDVAVYDFKLLHLGSWGEDPNLPYRTFEQAAEIVDIAVFKNDFFRALDSLRPDCVIFTSLEPLAHRAFLHACKSRGIPALHLMHGFNSQFSFDAKHGPRIRQRLFGRVKSLISNLRRYIFHVLPTVLLVLFQTEAKLKIYLNVVSEMLLKVYGKPRFNLSVLGRADLCLAFLSAEKRFLSERYNYKFDEILIVGFPDVFKYGDVNDVKVYSSKSLSIVYIETGFDAMGWQNSIGEFKDFIAELNDFARSIGYTLKVRLKPAPKQRSSMLNDFLNTLGVVAICDTDLLTDIVNAKVILAEPSTLVLLPMSLNKKILWNGIAPNKRESFGEVFLEYPKGKMIENFQELKNSITSSSSSLLEADRVSNRWICKNLTIVSEDAFWNSVVSNLKHLMKN